MTAASIKINNEYDVVPDTIIDLSSTASGNDAKVTRHKHVVIKLDDASEIWLDISTDLDDHDFIDLRWFNDKADMKGVGAFTIVNGRRQMFGSAFVDGTRHSEEPLLDANSDPVTGHKFNGGYVVTLLVDKNGEEAATKPLNTNGAG